MSRVKKTPLEKLKTKISHILTDEAIKNIKHQIKANGKTLFTYNETSIKYTKYRYYPSKVESLVEEDFEVIFPLTSENLSLLSSNPSNPPKGTYILIDLIRKSTRKPIRTITIGYESNKIYADQLFVTKDFYETILKINKEEGKDKTVRFNNRVIPFLKTNFNIQANELSSERDYSLLLEEVIASGEFTQKDLINISSRLEEGNSINIVVEKQIVKQAGWLIEIIQEIIDEGKLNIQKSKELGFKHFGFSKSSITGPEHLMEKILTRFGKYTLFGVPVLLNTDKYVVHKAGLTRSQFDIILINHLSDIEVVELKRPDVPVLEYDENRGKFYASKDLSIAVSQSERYISAVYRDNDEDYKINDQKIRDFLNSQIGGAMTVEICRPKALIIMGSYQTLAVDYEKLTDKTKKKVKKENYVSNYLQAYKELKEAYKNIHILTYSELIENARTRLITNDNE